MLWRLLTFCGHTLHQWDLNLKGSIRNHRAWILSTLAAGFCVAWFLISRSRRNKGNNGSTSNSSSSSSSGSGSASEGSKEQLRKRTRGKFSPNITYVIPPAATDQEKDLTKLPAFSLTDDRDGSHHAEGGEGGAVTLSRDTADTAAATTSSQSGSSKTQTRRASLTTSVGPFASKNSTNNNNSSDNGPVFIIGSGVKLSSSNSFGRLGVSNGVLAKPGQKLDPVEYETPQPTQPPAVQAHSSERGIDDSESLKQHESQPVTISVDRVVSKDSNNPSSNSRDSPVEEKEPCSIIESGDEDEDEDEEDEKEIMRMNSASGPLWDRNEDVASSPRLDVPSQSVDSPRDTASSGKLAEKRKKVIQELFATEESYVRNLHLLVNHYVEPMREACQKGQFKLTPEECATVFSNIASIVDLHDSFLSELQKQGIDGNIASVLIKFSDFFRMYTQFVSSYDKGLQVLNDHSNDKKLKAFLQEKRIHRDACGLDLMSYLIMPVQRIPRYELLLREIIKNTPEDHEQHDPLEQALTKIKALAVQLNERKRQLENMSQLLTIQNTVKGLDPTQFPGDSLFIPSRRCLRRDLVYVKDFERSESSTSSDKGHKRSFSLFGGASQSKGKAVFKQRHVVVFNDCILWFSTEDKFKGVVFLTNAALNLVEIDPLSISPDVSSGATLSPVTTPDDKRKRSVLRRVKDVHGHSLPTRNTVEIAGMTKDQLNKNSNIETVLQLSFATEAEMKSWQKDVFESISFCQQVKQSAATAHAIVRQHAHANREKMHRSIAESLIQLQQRTRSRTSSTEDAHSESNVRVFRQRQFGRPVPLSHSISSASQCGSDDERMSTQNSHLGLSSVLNNSASNASSLNLSPSVPHSASGSIMEPSVVEEEEADLQEADEDSNVANH